MDISCVPSHNNQKHDAPSVDMAKLKLGGRIRCGRSIRLRRTAWLRQALCGCFAANLSRGTEEMKPIILTLGLVATFGISAYYSPGETDYVWEQIVPPGNGRFPDQCGPGHWPMGIIPFTGFHDMLWMVGQRRVWSSRDAVTWNAQEKTDFGERHGMAFAFFRDAMWMLGGMKSWDDFRNDVWQSTNGTDWEEITFHAPWSARRGHSAVIFKGMLWVIGGAVSSGRADRTPTQFLSDIWRSSDGIRWFEVLRDAPWPARDGQNILVFNNQLWMIGGSGYSDIWRTANGVDWTKVASQSPWGERQNAGYLVYDSKLWVFGGRGKNDVWNSIDGLHWNLVTQHAPWSTRTSNHCIVFQNRLWLFSGKTGRDDSWAGDIWAMSPARGR